MSEKHIKLINQNRIKSAEIMNSQNKNIPILENDTDKVIEFNSEFTEIKNKKKRNFWDLFNN